MKPWYWVSIDKKTGQPFENQKTNVCPEKLFATSVNSPVNDSVKLVAFTRDLSSKSRQKLEIITGPIDYDDNDSLGRIMLVMQAFSEAAATCTDTNGQCRIGIADLTQRMTTNPLMAHAAADGGPITFAPDAKVGMFNNMLQECVLVWTKGYDTSGTNTQTNVGLELSSLAAGKLVPLFSGYNDESSGWDVSRRGYNKALDVVGNEPPIEAMTDSLAAPPALGLFALLAYLMNAETYSEHYKSTKERWHGWEGKSVQDVYLKTSPAELVAHVRATDPAARALFDNLPMASEEEKQELANSLCVANKPSGALNCRPRLDSLIALLANPTDETYRAFLSDIPKPIPMFQRYGRTAFVVEARRRNNPINEASTFRRKIDGTIELTNLTKVRELLSSFAWH